MKDVKAMENKDKVSFVMPVIKGALMALSFCLVAILIFAFVLRFVTLSDSVIVPINQLIKTFSIMFGIFFALKKVKKQGLILGMLIGCLFSLVAFVCFSLLSGSLAFSTIVINDCLFASVIGAICGIISVNLKK